MRTNGKNKGINLLDSKMKTEPDGDGVYFVHLEDKKDKFKKIINSTTGNKKIWNNFLYLIEEKTFNRDIEKIKDKYIDENNKIKDLKEYTKTIRNLCIFYGLDDVWTKSLMKYVRTGELPKENFSSPCVVLDRTQIGEDEEPEELYENVDPKDWPVDFIELKPISYSHPVIIRVTPYASQREIIDYIKKTYRYGIKPIQEKFQRKNIRIGKQRTKNPNIKKRNDLIYKNAFSSDKSINRILIEKGFEPIKSSLINKVVQNEKKKRK